MTTEIDEASVSLLSACTHAARLNFTELARQSGVPLSLITRYRTAEVVPSRQHADALAAVLGELTGTEIVLDVIEARLERMSGMAPAALIPDAGRSIAADVIDDLWRLQMCLGVSDEFAGEIEVLAERVMEAIKAEAMRQEDERSA